MLPFWEKYFLKAQKLKDISNKVITTAPETYQASEAHHPYF